MFEPCENLSRHALMLSLKSGIATAMRAGREASVMPCMENHCQPQPRSLGWGRSNDDDPRVRDRGRQLLAQRYQAIRVVHVVRLAPL